MTLYADDVNYWKTGQSSADTWIDKAKAEIRAAGGTVLSDAYGRDAELLGDDWSPIASAIAPTPAAAIIALAAAVEERNANE